MRFSTGSGDLGGKNFLLQTLVGGKILLHYIKILDLSLMIINFQEPKVLNLSDVLT